MGSRGPAPARGAGPFQLIEACRYGQAGRETTPRLYCAPGLTSDGACAGSTRGKGRVASALTSGRSHLQLLLSSIIMLIIKALHAVGRVLTT
jgi:hypothetical protein